MKNLTKLLKQATTNRYLTTQIKVLFSIISYFITTILVLQVDSSQEVALKARVAALIKTKNFDQAIETLKGKEK